MTKISSFGKDEPDIVLEIEAKETKLVFESGIESNLWCYEGKILKGPKSTLKKAAGSYLGPTIEVKSGDKIRIKFRNSLKEKSIIHWHGLDVSHENDGHPRSAVKPKSVYIYDFVVENRAGMYWYHPHPHGNTGRQVYMGLAGLFIVRDKEEQNLNLPSNEHELNYVIQDRFINEEGRLEYRPSMMGAFGNRIFINGLSKNKFKVRRGLNRIRLLNGCNARIFNFELDKGKDVWQIGSDGGLLKKPHRLKKFFFAPAERIDFLFDFPDYSIGEIVKLESLPLVDGRGKKYTVIEFEVTEESDELYSIPTFLSNLPDINPREAANLNSPKRFELVPKRGVGWTINGHGYEENRYENEELIKFGTTEAWEFYNPTGIPHPMHIHGTQFQVIKRYPSEFEGCLDKGWKDTILVMPGDRVKVINRFNTFKGDFLYHCHNLEHEDMSMMRNFRIY